MKAHRILGAMLVSVALCSSGFGGELLDRMLWLGGLQLRRMCVVWVQRQCLRTGEVLLSRTGLLL